MLALLAGALAAEVLVYAPEGAPAPGGVGVLEVAVSEAGAAVEGAAVELSAGATSLTIEGEPTPGRYRFHFEAPADTRIVNLTARVPGEAPVMRALPLAAPPEPSFDPPAEVEAAVGTPRIEFRFPRRRALRGSPDALVARVSEGRVLEVRAEAEAVVVAVEPGAERQARVMAVALADLDDPRGTPAFGLVRLRARPQLAITAEPGSTVSVRVGRRSYGPFVADKTGSAALAFDAWPGESTYEIVVADDLGNTQRSSGPLPVATRPALVGVEIPAGERGTDIWLGAWSPAGGPWSGAAPLCRSGAAGRADATALGRGLYRVAIQVPEAGGALFDPRVECALAEASLALRLPLGADRPDRVELRVFPDALSADFPIAEVQAVLLDRRGERLPVDGLRVAAESGELQFSPVDRAVRGEYHGARAIERGGDVLTAAWDHPAGEGVPGALDVAAAGDAGGLDVRVRVRDRKARPLGGAPVRVRVGEEAADAVTDARGWATVRLEPPANAVVVRAEVPGGITHEVPFFPAAAAVLPDPAAADLSARVEVPIRAGRVRQVFLDVEPRPLILGSGASGLVTVRMLDAAGRAIVDEPLTVEASEGELGPPEPRADGSIRIRYTPAAATGERTVRIAATTSSGTVATDLLIAPQPVRGGVGVSAGWIANFGVVSAPTLSISAYNNVPGLPRILGVRGGVSAYTVATSFVEEPIGELVTVDATMVPVDLGVQVLERWGPRSLHAGIAGVLTPYAARMGVGGVSALEGVGLASPGLSVHAGAGYRLGSSELYLEGRFLLFTATSAQLAFEGSVGGLSLSAGYRLLY